MIHIISNDLAGNGKGALARLAAEAELKNRGLLYRVSITEFPGHAKLLTENACKNKDTDTIITVGGDGTINETLNGFSRFDEIALGIMPCGTGNDFAAAAGLPLEFDKAIKVILDGQPQFTDYLKMGDILGLNAIGTGIDVDVLLRYAAHKKKTKRTYLHSLISALFHFKPYKFHSEYNGQKNEHSAFLVVAGNGSTIGGGLKLCPKASIDDGLMDVVIVEELAKPLIPYALIKMLNGKILDLKQTAFKRVKELTIHIDSDNAPVQVDGEIHYGVPLNISVVSNKLRIYRPINNRGFLTATINEGKRNEV